LKSCDDHQLALEMRRHGALDPSAAREVEAHLATCPDCQKVEAQAQMVSDLLRSVPRERPSQLEAIMAKVAKEERLARLLPLGLFGSFVLQGALVSWLIAPDSPLETWRLFWVAGAVGAAVSALLMRAHRRRARAALSRGVDAWISERRTTLLGYRARLKFVRFAGPAAALATGVAAARAAARGDLLAPFLWVVTAIFAVGVVAMARYGSAVERELQSLGERVAS